MKERLLIPLAALLLALAVALPAIPANHTPSGASVAIPVLPTGDCQGSGSCGG